MLISLCLFSALMTGVEAALQRLLSSPPASIPVVIDGVEEHFTGDGDAYEQRAPTDIQRVVSKGKRADKGHVHRAIKGAMRAREAWQSAHSLSFLFFLCRAL